MGFDELLEAGRRQDLQALLVALKSSCIDERQVGSICSAVSVLAFEGDFVAVEFLIKQGANIDHAVEGAARGGHRLYIEELLGRGAAINFAVYGAAIAGHEAYVKELLQRGAMLVFAVNGAARRGNSAHANQLLSDNNYVYAAVYGAVMGGHKAYVEELFLRVEELDVAVKAAAFVGDRVYAEELIGRGASTAMAAFGAGASGQRAYAEELLLRGIPIHYVAQGAAEGGHKAYAEELLRRGALMSILLTGAASAGHIAYVEELLARGASIEHIASYITPKMAELIQNNLNSQMRLLSPYKPHNIPLISNAFKTAINPIMIDPTTEKRAIALSRNRQTGDLNYAQTLARTAPECQGALFLLMILVMKKSLSLPNQVPSLFFDLWAHVFRFITPVPLNKASLTQLGFVSGRTYLRAQLSTYQAGWGKNKARALCFFKDLSRTGNLEVMQDLIALQTQVLQGKNPYPLIEWDKEYKSNCARGAVDRFHGIIGLWESMRTGEAVVFEEDEDVVVEQSQEVKPKCAIQ